MEKKTTIKVPDAYLPLLEDIRLLQETNRTQTVPRLISKSKSGRVCRNTAGHTQLVTNKDGTYVDGEQRAQVCIVA